MCWRIFCALLCLGLANTPPAQATNVTFLPGDSFFHFYLSEKTPVLHEGKPWEVNYGYPPKYQGNFCGYAGFSRLRITGDVRPLWAGARRVYDVIREEHESQTALISRIPNQEREIHETNPVHVFVYNQNVKFPGQQIGLKYNEGWTKLPRDNDLFSLGKHGYLPFVNTPEAIIEDWYYGDRYPALNVKVPEGPVWWKPGNEIVDPPVEIEASQVQLLLVHQAGFLKAVQENHGAIYWIVKADGAIDVCSWRQSEQTTIRYPIGMPPPEPEKEDDFENQP